MLPLADREPGNAAVAGDQALDAEPDHDHREEGVTGARDADPDPDHAGGCDRDRNARHEPAPLRLPASRSRVQRDGALDEILERALVELLALVDVDGTPHVALEARVEELRRILQPSALEER